MFNGLDHWNTIGTLLCIVIFNPPLDLRLQDPTPASQPSPTLHVYAAIKTIAVIVPSLQSAISSLQSRSYYRSSCCKHQGTSWSWCRRARGPIILWYSLPVGTSAYTDETEQIGRYSRRDPRREYNTLVYDTTSVWYHVAGIGSCSVIGS